MHVRKLTEIYQTDSTVLMYIFHVNLDLFVWIYMFVRSCSGDVTKMSLQYSAILMRVCLIDS